MIYPFSRALKKPEIYCDLPVCHMFITNNQGVMLFFSHICDKATMCETGRSWDHRHATLVVCGKCMNTGSSLDYRHSILVACDKCVLTWGLAFVVSQYGKLQILSLEMVWKSYRIFFPPKSMKPVYKVCTEYWFYLNVLHFEKCRKWCVLP